MFERQSRAGLAVLVLLIVASCATGTPSSNRSSGNVLTYDDLLEAAEPDLYRAIERLQSRWLRPRGQGTPNSTAGVTLFIDGSFRGNVDQMRGIPITDVRDVTYLTPTAAAQRFGTRAGGNGTISIRTSR